MFSKLAPNGASI